MPAVVQAQGHGYTAKILLI